MLEIASRAKMETSAIIQYIIDDIIDDEANKVILYGAISISELKRKFDLYETVKSRSKYHIETDERKKKSARADDKKEEKRCYNCGDKNHLSAACPTKERGGKCFKCDEYGHIVVNCAKATDKKTKNCNAT